MLYLLQFTVYFCRLIIIQDCGLWFHGSYIVSGLLWPIYRYIHFLGAHLHFLDTLYFDNVIICRRSMLSQQYAVIVLAVHLSSWFVTYCGCRSLSNTLEMDSFLIGLFLVYQLNQMQKHSITPQQYHQPRSFLYLALLALLVVQSVFSRPTAALLWVRMRWISCLPMSWCLLRFLNRLHFSASHSSFLNFLQLRLFGWGYSMSIVSCVAHFVMSWFPLPLVSALWIVADMCRHSHRQCLLRRMDPDSPQFLSYQCATKES